MTTLRCTAKLLKRLRIKNPGEPPAPKNCLGDWFANIIYTPRGHFVILVSERSLLPVITTARDLDKLVPRFLRDLSEVLSALGVPAKLIDMEIEQMLPVYFGRTNSPKILGSMNDFVQIFKWSLDDHPDSTLIDWSLFLAQAPCRPIGMESPNTLAPRLLRNPHQFTVIGGGES